MTCETKPSELLWKWSQHKRQTHREMLRKKGKKGLSHADGHNALDSKAQHWQKMKETEHAIHLMDTFRCVFVYTNWRVLLAGQLSMLNMTKKRTRHMKTVITFGMIMLLSNKLWTCRSIVQFHQWALVEDNWTLEIENSSSDCSFAVRIGVERIKMRKNKIAHYQIAWVGYILHKAFILYTKNMRFEWCLKAPPDLWIISKWLGSKICLQTIWIWTWNMSYETDTGASLKIRILLLLAIAQRNADQYFWNFVQSFCAISCAVCKCLNPHLRLWQIM